MISTSSIHRIFQSTPTEHIRHPAVRQTSQTKSVYRINRRSRHRWSFAPTTAYGNTRETSLKWLRWLGAMWYRRTVRGAVRVLFWIVKAKLLQLVVPFTRRWIYYVHHSVWANDEDDESRKSEIASSNNLSRQPIRSATATATLSEHESLMSSAYSEELAGSFDLLPRIWFRLGDQELQTSWFLKAESKKLQASLKIQKGCESFR